jgi:hypothetical protein
MTEEEANTIALTLDKKNPEEDKYIKWAQKLATKAPFIAGNDRGDPSSYPVWNVAIAKCFNCDDMTVWISGRLVYPASSNVTAPNADMPEDAKFDYREAASIAEQSPRGAAALLRLAIEKICIALGCTGKSINDDIAELVSKGLDARIQKALDIVRVTGNNAVHPGEMDLNDNPEVVQRLFSLVNLITDVLITQPKQIGSLYESLPEGARMAVVRRDAAKKTPPS